MPASLSRACTRELQHKLCISCCLRRRLHNMWHCSQVHCPQTLPAVRAVQVLPRALRHMLAKSDEKTRAAVNKVIRVWDERKVRVLAWGLR